MKIRSHGKSANRLPHRIRATQRYFTEQLSIGTRSCSVLLMFRQFPQLCRLHTIATPDAEVGGAQRAPSEVAHNGGLAYVGGVVSSSGGSQMQVGHFGRKPGGGQLARIGFTELGCGSNPHPPHEMVPVAPNLVKARALGDPQERGETRIQSPEEDPRMVYQSSSTSAANGLNFTDDAASLPMRARFGSICSEFDKVTPSSTHVTSMWRRLSNLGTC